MHMLVEAINLHVITSSWDLQFLSCLSESTRLKSAIINVAANMKEGGMRQIMCNGIKATRTGTLFYDTIKVNIYVARHFFENHYQRKHWYDYALLHIIIFFSPYHDWITNAIQTWFEISSNTEGTIQRNFHLWKKFKH